MGKYFSLIYEGPEFQLFGTPHLIAIAIITAFCLSGSLGFSGVGGR